MGEPKYKLVYFDVRALGEPIRMMFIYTGTPFKDERVPWDLPKWFAETKHNYENSIGQLPVLYWDDKELSNSQVITRYLAKQLGLCANNDWDNARVDEVMATVHDVFILWRTVSFERDPERKAFMKSTFLNPKIKLCYEKWSKVLSEKKGPFILGEKVTHADFWLATFISIWDNPMSGAGPVLPEGWSAPSEADLFVGMTKDYPLLKKHMEAVENIPQIKEWIEKRPKTIA